MNPKASNVRSFDVKTNYNRRSEEDFVIIDSDTESVPT